MTDYQVTITNDILNLISEIDEFKGKWQAINTLSPDRLKMLKKSATIEFKIHDPSWLDKHPILTCWSSMNFDPN